MIFWEDLLLRLKTVGTVEALMDEKLKIFFIKVKGRNFRKVVKVKVMIYSELNRIGCM